MNLVQIQERLKDAPVQAIMQYANGGNPMVPPYLALAELKRRESINQSAQSQQAMQQGQAPSVKEQIEKSAGLAALQQQMQQQGMQSLMAQARPQGIPQNVPQPSRQPESEGISGLPAGDFNFADGGIVAFQGGGETEVMSIEQMRAEYQKLLRANRRVEANEMLEKIKTRQGMERRPITTPAAPARGIAALPGADEAQKMILEQMRAKPDLSQAAEEYRKAQGLFGLTQPYGEERMKRAQAMEAARQQELESRGMERLMRVMGGIGARGLQGASPAYLQSIEAERAADAAFRKQMDELMGGVEEKRRAEAVSGMTDAQKRIAEERKSAQEAAGKIMDADTKFKLQELQQKAVRERLSPEEEYIRNEIIKGRKYPEIIEELARAKGATRTEADVQKAQLKREAEWNEISGDILRRQEWAKLGVRTLEDYLRYVQRSSGGAGESSTVASGIPPIPAGAVRLKGAQ